MTIKEHKILEHQAYEALYSAEEKFASSEIRDGLLHESEDYFCSRLRELSKNAQVLEIGCGTGSHSIMAAQAGAAMVVATDIAEAALVSAKKSAERVGVADRMRFEKLDIESPENFQGQFDLIINHEVFSSLDLDKALPHLRRLLKPGGMLLSIECLGGNPVFNLNRRISVLRGRRTAWAAAHIVKQRDFEKFKKYFPDIRISYFHLLTLFAAPLWIRPVRNAAAPLLRAVRGLDAKAMKSKFAQNLAFKIVFEAR